MIYFQNYVNQMKYEANIIGMQQQINLQPINGNRLNPINLNNLQEQLPLA